MIIFTLIGLVLFVLLCTTIFFLAKWMVLRKELIEEQEVNDELDAKFCMALERIEDLKRQKDEAYENLETVLDSRPGPFNEVAAEISTNGVVFQFRNEEFLEGTGKVSA